MRTHDTNVTRCERPVEHKNIFRYLFVLFCKKCIPMYWLCDAIGSKSDSYIVLSLKETKAAQIVGGKFDGAREFEGNGVSSFAGSVEHLKALMDHMDVRIKPLESEEIEVL